jgi:hypothetical protein
LALKSLPINPEMGSDNPMDFDIQNTTTVKKLLCPMPNYVQQEDSEELGVRAQRSAQV